MRTCERNDCAAPAVHFIYLGISPNEYFWIAVCEKHTAEEVEKARLVGAKIHTKPLDPDDCD
jgi:hypothetical protein